MFPKAQFGKRQMRGRIIPAASKYDQGALKLPLLCFEMKTKVVMHLYQQEEKNEQFFKEL